MMHLRGLTESYSPAQISLTLNASLQRYTETLIDTELQLKQQKNMRQMAALIVDNATGEILAWVGSGRRTDPSGGLIDMVITPRSVGSTIKPFIYALVLHQNHPAATIYADIPFLLRTPQGIQQPHNYNNHYRGPLLLREALACSQNIPAMRALKQIGNSPALLHLFKSLQFQFSSQTLSESGLGLAIGNGEFRLYDLVSGYATLARQGQYIPLKFKQHNTAQPTSLTIPELSATTCFILADILSDNTARAQAFGFHSPLKFNYPVAVKTGTSSNYRDNWCIGFTKDYTIGIWAGNTDASQMKNISGIEGTGEIFHKLMDFTHQIMCNSPHFFTPPPELHQETVDSRTGHIITETFIHQHHIPSHYLKKEWFIETPSQPLPSFYFAQPEDYDEQGRVRLSADYKPWYDSKENNLKKDLTIDETLWTGEPPEISSPTPEGCYLIDPDFSQKDSYLKLNSNLPTIGSIWSSPTLPILYKKGHPYIPLKPGRHSLSIDNDTYHIHKEIHFQIKSL